MRQDNTTQPTPNTNKHEVQRSELNITKKIRSIQNNENERAVIFETRNYVNFL